MSLTPTPCITYVSSMHHFGQDFLHWVALCATRGRWLSSAKISRTWQTSWAGPKVAKQIPVVERPEETLMPATRPYDF
jgi:hypothetical protein